MKNIALIWYCVVATIVMLFGFVVGFIVEPFVTGFKGGFDRHDAVREAIRRKS